MASKNLKASLNQIREWVTQERTDAWIAHQLDVTAQEIEQFRKENQLGTSDGQEDTSSAAEQVDLRAQDDAVVAAELEEEAKKIAEQTKSGVFEGTFDHGEEGYGLWLDPAIQDNAVYAEHWAGHRPVSITIEEDVITIRRV